MTYEFTAYSIPGGIEFHGAEKRRHAQTLARFRGGMPVKVVYKPIRKTRTPDQNRLYWKRNEELSSVTGYSKEALHEGFMSRAGYGRKVATRTAEYFFRESSTELDTVQFSELMKYQDELAEFLNDGLDPENWLILTTGDVP